MSNEKVNCRNCGQELTEKGTMDDYQLCHPCYCIVMDKTNTKNGVGKMSEESNSTVVSWYCEDCEGKLSEPYLPTETVCGVCLDKREGKAMREGK